MTDPGPEGGWCWFHSPRAVPWDGRIAVGMVWPGDASGTGVTGVALVSGREIVRVPMAQRDRLDDHDAPAVLPWTHGRLLVGWTGHDDDPTISLATIDPATHDLTTVATIDAGMPLTYVNLITGPGPSLVRLVTRVRPVGLVVIEVDLAAGSTRFAPLLWHRPDAHDQRASGHDGGRPYAVFRQRGARAWFAANEDHPRAFRSGVWCGYLDGDTVYDADGTVARHLAWDERIQPAPDFDAFDGLTCVVAAGGEAVPWVQDLAFRPDDSPVIAFSRHRKDDAAFHSRPDVPTTALEYVRASRGPRGWTVEPIARAGSALGAREADYAGGLALNPEDPDQAAFSSDVPPMSLDAEADGHHRLYLADLRGGQARFQQVSGDEPCLRPVFTPREGRAGTGGHALLHLQGDYAHYTDFRLAPVVTPLEPGRTCWDGTDGHVDLPFPLDDGSGLPDRERDELDRRLAGCDTYLEYGAGSSTLRALRSRASRVVSIESNPALLRALAVATADVPDVRRRLRLIDPGWPVIGEWGYPLTGELAEVGRRYVALADAYPPADLVLIDGRFRCAAFLRVLSRVNGPTVVLWDDYRPRQDYHWIEEYARPVAFAGRMAVFELDRPVVAPAHARTSALRTPH